MRKFLRRYTPAPDAVHRNRLLAPFRATLLHPRLWHLNRHSAAGAVAAGLFCGMMPPPFQMPSAAVCAVAFRVNLPLAIVTTLYTNPLTFVPFYLLAFWVGQQFINGGAPFVPPPAFDFAAPGPSLAAFAGWLRLLGKPLAVGVLLLASVFSVAGYFGVRFAWRLWLLRAWRSRKLRRAQPPVAQR
ncbi:MAG: DUF2062 domain-containing protein [Pseudomonadota bacterium]